MYEQVSRYFDAYKAWVRRHAEALYLFETSLSSITWLLPDRFDGNELLLEGVHTASNLLSVFHESIISDLDTKGPRGAQELTLALNALQQVEVLIELYALYSKRFSSRYDALFIVESLKSFVRLAIFRISSQRLLLQGGLACFDVPPSSRRKDSSRKAKTILNAFKSFRNRHLIDNTPIRFDHNGSSVSTTKMQSDSSGSECKYWWSMHVNMRDSKSSIGVDRDAIQKFKQLEREIKRSNDMASKLLEAGEMLHIVRPMIYVLCLRVWGVQSWKPWTLSFIVDIASAQAIQYAYRRSNEVRLEIARDPALGGSTVSMLYAKQGITWSTDELDEITKRKLLLVLYLVRDPVFGKVTMPIMQRWIKSVKRVPLVSWFSERFCDFIEGIQKYYTYTSAA